MIIYIELLIKHLLEKGYHRTDIHTSTYKYNGKEYDRVEVLNEGYVIQVFVLMSAEHCRKLDKFPFYRSYNQWNDFGYLTPPACYVAVYISDDNWEYHNSSDLRLELTSPSFLNYNEAVERFKKRLSFCGNKKLRKKIRCLSISYLLCVLLYLAAHVLSFNGLLNTKIPLDSAITSVLILIMILLLVPPLIPYIKSITIKGLSFDIE